MKMMKKAILFGALILFSSVLFTSCIDIVQSINFKAGKYELGYRIVISKLACELAETDPNDFFDDFYTEDFDNLPYNAKMEEIDTEFDSGVALSFSVDPKNADEEIKKLLPKTLSNGRIKIPLFGTEEIAKDTNGAYDGDYEQIIKAFFSTAKWRIYIAKNIIPTISSACVRNTYGAHNLVFYEVGDTHCIEIPILQVSEDSYLELERKS